MKKFEKQNKVTIHRIIKMSKKDEWLFKLHFVDPITVNNIVGFVQQPHGLLTSIPTELKIIKPISGNFHYYQKSAIAKLLAISFSGRAYHSSDWKEVRYMEKADVDALMDSMLPFFMLIGLPSTPKTKNNYLRYLKSKTKGNRFSEWFRKSGTTEVTTRMNFLDFEILVNIWLFHPLMVEAFKAARVNIINHPDLYEKSVVKIYGLFINILRNIPWPNAQLMDEVTVWVKKN